MIHKLHHNLREPAHSNNIVPSLVGNSLLSTAKMVKTGYTAIYDDKEVNFYNTLRMSDCLIGSEPCKCKG
jgi:hypothetical protein